MAQSINSQWLTDNAASFGGPPYILGKSFSNTGTIYPIPTAGFYTLNTNVTVSGSAFMVLATGITFNLNGYNITYANTPPMTIVNPGFEIGSSGSTTPTGWDLSGAPAASLQPNNVFLFGNQVLGFSPFSTTQTVVTKSGSYIAIPPSITGHNCVATITPANVVNFGTTLTLNAIDSVTGKTLGTGASLNTQRGFSAVCQFIPSGTNPIKLQAVIGPVSSNDTISLDNATITVAYDYGLTAAGQYGPSFPGNGAATVNWPAAIQTLYANNRVTMLTNANFILNGPGQVTMGSGGGYGSSPFMFELLDGLTMVGVTGISAGLDTDLIDAYQAGFNGQPIFISGCTFIESSNNITDRQQGISTISVTDTFASTTVINNSFSGCPQFGISASNGNGPVILDSNTITQNSCVTDAYGISCVSIGNFQISNNIIKPLSGEGIIIDGYGSTPTTSGKIFGNTVAVIEGINRETGNNNHTRALRLRNDVDAEGPQTNIEIAFNNLMTTAWVSGSDTCFGAWFSFVNNGGAMNNANIYFHDNVVTSVINTTQGGFTAAALVYDQLDPGINLLVQNNTLLSNHIGLALNQYNDNNVYGITAVNNIFGIPPGYPQPNSYQAIQSGYDVSVSSGCMLINNQYVSGASFTIYWDNLNTSTPTSFETGYLGNLTVLHADTTAATGVQLKVIDKHGFVWFPTFVGPPQTNLTNISGQISVPIPVEQYMSVSAGATVSGILSPLTLVATLGSISGTLIVTPTTNTGYTITLPGGTGILTSITLLPINSTVNVGKAVQFIASGNYSDGSTQNITSQASWTSFPPYLGNITAGGSFSLGINGKVTITANSGGVSQSTNLNPNTYYIVI